MSVVRLGTRASALARWQSTFIASRLTAADPGLHIEIVDIVSTGDRVTDIPLSEVEGTGFFTAALEQALLNGEVDVAVHSYKDLPVSPTSGLVVAAVPARGPIADALCARDGLTLEQLPGGASIGTCSARRTAQIRALRQDLDIRVLRGNVPTRLERIATGDLDAIVLAEAGLARLGLDAAITQVFTPEQVLPAPAQGALAVQCRAADTALRARLATLEDAPTRRAVDAERTLLHALGGGCSVPVGALAECEGAALALTAGVFALQGTRALRVHEHGDDPIALGEAVAARLLGMGAGEVLAAFDKAPRLDVPLSAGSTR